ncbi:MAG: membrane protein insertion efficiency factor YidD [Patescibacteria group bacterium]|nr:membrane protein insertion efficiency factor YidD [Patescibacteria group bacterium]
MKKTTVAILNFYQQYLSFDRGVLSFLAPGGSCKYSPTCSEYTKQMVQKHGVLKGLNLGIRRIISCR